MKKKHVFYLYLSAWVVLFLLSLDTDKLSEAISGGELKHTLEIITGALDVGSAVALAILATFAYRNARRDDEWITVTARYPNGHEVHIHDAFQREECSRNEIAGVFGMINGPDRYKVRYLRSERFLADIKRIKTSSEVNLVIPITIEDQFNEPELVSSDELPESLTDQSTQQESSHPLVFWNVSNHMIEPSWSETQREAALALAPGAELIDCPFPNVNPEWTRAEVYRESRRVIDAWFSERGRRRIVAAMVAGEPLMCQALVEGLEARGVRCYSATTRREVVMEGDEKRSRFTFVKFRPFREG